MRYILGKVIVAFSPPIGNHKRHVWAYRKAAWLVDGLPETIGSLYAAQGEAGLLALPGIGKNIAADIALWLKEMELDPLPCSRGLCPPPTIQREDFSTGA